jgi:hypothetical protein
MALVYDAQGRLVDDGTGSAMTPPARTPTPGNPARAAAMQAQFNQPVTAGVPSQRNPNAINVGQAAADVLLGGLSVPGAALGDLARFRSTQALGGDVATLQGGVNPRLEAAQNRVSGGLSQLGTATSQAFQPVMEALGGTRNTALGALGAQPAQPTPAAAPAATTPARTAPAAAPTATAPLSADDPQLLSAQESSGYTGTGVGVGAQGGEIFRQDVNGVPTFSNVNANPDLQGLVGATGVEVGAPVVAPASEPMGLGGFGGGRGTAYLQQMAQQDAAAADRRREATREFERYQERSRLENIAMGRGSATDRAVARRGLAALDRQAEVAMQESGATQRQGLQTAAEQARAESAAVAAQRNAQIGAEGDILAAQIKAEATANTPANQRITQQLQTAAAYDQAAADAAANNRPDEAEAWRARAERARGIAQPAVGQIIQSVEGAPIGVMTAQGVRSLTQAELEGLMNTTALVRAAR